MNNRKRKIFLLLIFLAFLSFFLYIKVSPLGFYSCSSNLKYNKNIFSGKSCLSLPSPSQRYKLEDNLKVIADPLYFSLYSPRHFDKLKLDIKFKTNLSLNSPVFEAGLLVNKDLWQYQLKSVYNYWLQEEFSDWHETIENEILFLQKEKKFDNLIDFYQNFSLSDCNIDNLNNCIALYNNSKELDNILKSFLDYNINNDNKETKVDHSFRGFHSFYIFLDSNYLDLSLLATDLQKSDDRSSVVIDLYNSGSLIYSQTWPNDDKIEIDLKLDDLYSDYYRIDLKANSDIVFSNLKVNSSILSFRRKIHLFNDDYKDLDLYTDSNIIQAKVFSPLYYQTIYLDNFKYDILDVYLQHEIIQDNLNKDGNYLIKLEKDNILLESPGVFAFSREALFNPNFDRLDRFFKQQAEYVLANYSPVIELQGGYYRAEVEFDLKNVYRENNKYNLIFSIPGLRADDDISDYIEIKEIKAKFYGKNLIQKINEKVF